MADRWAFGNIMGTSPHPERSASSTHSIRMANTPQICIICLLISLASSCSRYTGPHILIASIESIQEGRTQWQAELEKRNTMWELGFDPFRVLSFPDAYDGNGAGHVSYAIENHGPSPLRVVDGRGGLNEKLLPTHSIQVFEGPFSNLSYSTASVCIDSLGTDSIAVAVVLTARDARSLSKPVAIVATPLGP